VVAACSNAVAGVLLDRGREGCRNCYQDLRKCQMYHHHHLHSKKCHPKQFSSYQYWVVVEALK
jgi:hypothetical protein